MRRVVDDEGASFADALAQTNTFPDLYVSMVRAGEVSGQIDTILERLAEYLEAAAHLRASGNFARAVAVAIPVTLTIARSARYWHCFCSRSCSFAIHDTATKEEDPR